LRIFALSSLSGKEDWLISPLRTRAWSGYVHDGVFVAAQFYLHEEFAKWPAQRFGL
jgi:hypothetical protein